MKFVINPSIFNAVSTLRFVIGPLCDSLQGKVRYGRTGLSHTMIRHVIDDSTAKKSRLLDREFIPKTEHLEMQFLHFLFHQIM